ncbi:MAG: hypothetical protein ACOYVE_10430 [Melioribacter sp.]|uniref:hypothetical protein n=1 Tax=Melioribacter sp. TaxID=2052167 RepID=UPI003BDB8C7D
MAQLDKKFFGKLKGSLGDIVFRSRNDKNYIAHKPVSYTPPDTPEFRERISKFRLAVKLASAIYSFESLKKLWKSVVPSGASPFSHLVKINYPFVLDNDLSNMIIMTPRSSFGVKLQSLTLNNDALDIELAPLTDLSNVNPDIEKKIQILVVVFLQQPLNSTLPDYDFLKVSSVKTSINLNDPITFNIPLLTADSEILVNYTNRKVIFTAITFDENEDEIQFSSTINYTVV